VPITPFFQNGGGQVPLRDFLPSTYLQTSSPSADIPKYPSIAVPTAQDSSGASTVPPDAPHKHIVPTIDISIQHTSYEHSFGQAPSSFAGAEGDSDIADPQMKGRKPAIAAAGTVFGLFSFSQIYQNVLFQRITPSSERAEENNWVASSHSWFDRKTCDWFGLCGLAHLDKTRWISKFRSHKQEGGAKVNLTEFWHDAQALPKNFRQEEREVPQYVLDYAPLIHLYSGEEYWPCDIAEHLIHTTPHLNYTPLQATDDHPKLTNLNELNKWGRFVYLQSDDNVEDRPEWLGGETNIPTVPDESKDDWQWEGDSREGGQFEEDKNGKKSDWFHVGLGDTEDRGGIRSASTSPGLPIPTRTPEGDELLYDDEMWQSELRNRRRQLMGKKVVGGRSDAPAVLVVVPKPNGVVDAFWFFFYSYNLGNAVFNVRFGNHVGDWEHTVVRFQDGEPKAVFFSEHSFGEAYTYDAVEKVGKRPVGYSATGTHAMYATPGVHPYILPGGILHDVTDRGPLWDPAKNMYSYTYNYQNDELLTSNLTPTAPVGFFYFAGHWGDKFYPLSDPRQYRFLGQYHYVNGPLGPRFKNLGRQEICQGNGECILKKFIGTMRDSKPKRYSNVGRGEEMTEEDAKRVFGKDYDSAS